MTRFFPLVLAPLLVVAVATGMVGAPPSEAKTKTEAKGDAKKAPPGAKTPPPGATVNACGCYRTEAGACLCGDKKAKCECPGDCEPMGCEAKRAKEVDREIAAETKRAQEDEKKRQAAEAAAQAARDAPPPPEDNGTTEEAEPGKVEKPEAKKPGRKATKDATKEGTAKAK